MKLSFDYQEIIFKAIKRITPIDEFETWLYADTELPKMLPENVYLDLISLDFRDRHIVHELEKLLLDYLDMNKLKGLFWQRELIQTLENLIRQPENVQELAKIYDWYCDGCGFMRLLALRYGLEAEMGEAVFSANAWAEIRQQAMWLWQSLQSGEIELFPDNDPNFPFHKDYFDYRSEQDRQKTDFPDSPLVEKE